MLLVGSKGLAPCRAKVGACVVVVVVFVVVFVVTFVFVVAFVVMFVKSTTMSSASNRFASFTSGVPIVPVSFDVRLFITSEGCCVGVEEGAADRLGHDEGEVLGADVEQSKLALSY